MNTSGRLDSWSEALTKHVIALTLALVINCINGTFVYTFFKSRAFQQDPRYVLYIHLVINDMILLSTSVMLQVMIYTVPLGFAPCCVILLISITTNKNSPLNLAGMAVERYIAVCRPLRHTYICTVQRAHALIALIWLVSFSSTIINLIILASQPAAALSGNVLCHPMTLFNTPHHAVFQTVFQVLLFSFIFLTIFITYFRVFLTAQAASGSDQVAAKRARNTIALHGVQLLICMLSYLSPLINVFLITSWFQSKTRIMFTSYLLTNILPRLLSPLIYGVRDQKFSSHIRMHFSGCCGSAETPRVKLAEAQGGSKQAGTDDTKFCS